MLERMLDLKNTFEGKFIAVFMSVVLVMSMTNIFAFAGNEGEQAPADETATEQPAKASEQAVDASDEQAVSEAVQHGTDAAASDASDTNAPAATPSEPLVTTAVDEAVVTFEMENAYVSVKDQVLSGKTLTTELHKELQFSASADTAFELESITAKNAANADVPVTTQDGISTIAAEYVDSTLVVTATAKAVAADEPAVETKPITSDTKIEATEDVETPEGDEPATDVADESAVEAPAADDEVVEVEADVSSPAFEGYATVGGTTVKVTAAEGILPEGTTVQAVQITSSAIIDAVESTVEEQGKELETALAIDVTLVGPSGNVIQPSAAVNVCFFNAEISGETLAVYHVTNDGSSVSPVAARQVDADVQSFDVSHFSIYVVTGEGTPRLATYNFYDASGYLVSTQIVKTGDTLYEPEAPVAENGQFFEGWYAKNGDNWSAKFNSFGEQTVAETAALDLHAKFSEAYYVYFMDNQGRVYATKSGAQGDEISTDDVTFPLAPNEGITGWFTDESLTNKVDGSVKLDGANVTLYPKVEQGNWITFDAKGGSYTAPDFVGVGDTSVQPEAPSRAGYSFDGWYDNESYSGTAYAFGSSVESDVTLYAKWTPGKAKYRLVVWLEAADSNDDAMKYDYVTTLDYEGTTDDVVTLPGASDIKNSVDAFIIDKQHIRDASDQKSDATITVQGDGSAIANVYLDRVDYTIDLRCTKKSSSNTNDYSSVRTITANYGANISKQWADAIQDINGTYGTRVWAANPSNVGTTPNPVVAPFQTMTENRTLYYVSNGNALHHLELKVEQVGNSKDIKIDDPNDSRYKKGYKYSSNNDVSMFELQDTLVFNGAGVHATIANYVNSLNGFEWVGADLASNEGFFQVGNVWTARHYFQRKSYTITFNNEQAVSTSDPIKYGTPISDQTATPDANDAGVPEGSTFGGWYTSPTFAEGTEFDFTDATMPANNLVLYAKWTLPTYKVTYYKDNAGTTVAQSSDVKYGETTVNESSHIADVPEGYKWVGWMTRSGSDGNYTYLPFNFNTQIYGDTELYPYYINSEERTLTYNANNGSGDVPVDAHKYAQGSFAEVAQNSLTAPADDQMFLGWNTKQDGTGATYYPGSMVQLGAENVTLYAQWGKPSPKTSLTYNANGGTGASSSTTDIVNNDEVILKSAEELNFKAPRSGMEFTGWTTAEDGSGPVYAAGTPVHVDINEGENILYAKWVASAAYITFEENGGTEVADMEGVTYQVVDDRAMPSTTREGYTFDGWYDNAQLSGEAVASLPAEYPVGTTTYYAKWVPRNDIAYTVNYYLSGASVEVAPSKSVEGQTMDTEVVENAINVAGYTAIAPTSETLKLAAEDNVITFYYEADFSSFSARGFDVVYDGAAHEVELKGDLLSDDTVEYWANGSQLASNEFVEVVDSAKVTVKVIRNGVEWSSDPVDATIAKRPIVFMGEGWDSEQPYTGEEYRTESYEVEQANADNTSGLVAGQSVDGLTYLLYGTDVKHYEGAFSGSPSIMAGDQDVTTNYKLSMAAGTLDIVASPIATYVKLTPQDVSRAYDGMPLAAGIAMAFDENGNKITVEYSANGVDGWTENPADIVATHVADTKTVYVRASAEGVYTGFVGGTQKLEITPAAAVVRVNDASKTYGAADPSFSGAVEGLFGDDSLGEVTYARTNDAEGVGVYPGVLTATVTNANPDYTHTVVSGDFAIARADGNNVSIDAEGLVKTYDGKPASAKAEADQPGSTLLYSLDGEEWSEEPPSFTDAGTYEVRVKAANPNYEDTPVVSANIVINRAPVVITVDNATKVFGSDDPSFSGTVEGLVAEGDLGEVAYVRTNADEDVERYADVLTARYADNANYAVTVSNGSFEITPRAIDADAPTNVVYNGQEQKWAPAVTDMDGNVLVEGVDYTVSYGSDATNVGSVGVTITGVGNYAGTVERSYEITPAAAVVRVNDASKTYGAADPSFSGAVEGLFGDDSLGEVAYVRTNADEDAGSYADVLSATVANANPNYAYTVVPGDFSIAPAGSNLVRAEGLTKTYDGKPASATAEADRPGSTLLYSLDGEEWSEEPPSFTDAGTYEVRVKAANPNYEETPVVTANVVVNRAPATIAVADASKTYGAADPSFSGTVEGLIADDDLGEINYVRAGGNEAVGVYADALTALYSPNTNYSVKVVNGSFEITPRAIDADAPRNVVYNGQEQKWAPAVTDEDGNVLVEGVDYTVSYNADATNVGTVVVTITGVGNYAGTVERTYSITPAPAVIHVNDASKLFNADDPAFSGSIEGLFDADSLGDVTYRRTNSDEAVGAYEGVLTASVDNLNPNYTYTVEPGAFTIEPAGGNIVRIATDADGLVKTYDGQPSSITAEADVDDSTLLYSTDGENWFEENPTFTNAGAYIVYVKATHPGYEETAAVSATVVINKAPVTITVADSSKIAGTADPTFTGTIEGLVAGGDLGEVTYVRPNGVEEVGVYADVLTALYTSNDNYAVTVIPGTFTITAAAPPTPPTPVTPTPATPTPTPTPLPTPGTPPADNPLTPIIAPVVDALATAAETVIGDNATPLAQNTEPRETEIGDNETPLAGVHAWCWVHWYIILGIIVTAVYAACVALRRGLFSRKLKKYEDDLTGGGDPAPGAPSTDGDVAAPVMPKGVPAGATLAAGLGE